MLKKWELSGESEKTGNPRWCPVKAEKVLEDLKIGDSVAVNGVCRTVVEFFPGGFGADVMHETLDRSTLGSLKPGSRVNLERAMAAGGPLWRTYCSGTCGRTRRCPKDQER